MAYELTVVVPTLNEADNVRPLVERLERVLAGERWEVVFVDDDSTDGTAAAVSALAAERPNVRLIVRIGRRGLSSACIEGMLSSTAPLCAVMDGDLQHDEAALPRMLERARADGLELVIASRFAEGSRIEGLTPTRTRLSRIANRIGRAVARAPLSDPMTGFFLVRRALVDEVAHRLSGTGFKILLDIFASAGRPLAYAEVPMTFRERLAGESKLDAAVMLAFAAMIWDKTAGRRLPGTVIALAAEIAASVGLHLALLAPLAALLAGRGPGFAAAQAIAAAAVLAATFAAGRKLGPRHARRGPALARFAGFAARAVPGLAANVAFAAALAGAGAPWPLAGAAGAFGGALWTRAANRVRA